MCDSYITHANHLKCVDATPKELRFYVTATDQAPCRDWLDDLERTNKKMYGILSTRLSRVERGNFGDCEPVGEGVSELRVDVGPGYRIYFGRDDDLVVLLKGGTKKTQASDISEAKRFWSDYNA